MNAETVLQWASDLGITLTLKNDRIQYRPKSRVPDEFVEGLRQYKGQVVERLDRQFRDELKRRYPRSRPSDEIAEIKRRLADSGICLTWCTALDDFVAFHRDDVPPDAVPAGFVPYSESELLYLFNDDGLPLSPGALKRVHAAKLTGAVVTGRRPVEGDSAP